MIIKISARELRELMSSGSVPQWGVLGSVTRPVGDGKSKSTMAYGSDRDIDKKRIETLESVADFNERAFRRDAGVFAKDTTDWARWVRRRRDTLAVTYGELRAMGLPTHCSEPVYADVPPMPEGYLNEFPSDCTAAMFGRRFSEAFDAWLDAFDYVLRTLPGGDKGRRMLDMESYAVTDTDAVVMVYRLEGGVRKGGPFHEHRVHLKPRFLVGKDCGAYVDGVVSNEVDALVMDLGSALGFDEGQMAGVRARVAHGVRPPLHDEAHDVTGGNADEGMAGTADVTDAGGDDGVKKRLEKLRSALWESLDMMSDSINHQLERNDNGMQVVVNTVTGGTAVIVYVQVRNGKEDWTRGKCWTVDLSQVEGEDYDAVADTVVPEWSREVFRAVMRGDWGGWRESSMACSREVCGRAEAGANDYDEMRVPAPGPGFGSRSADAQDYDIDDDRHVEGVGEDGGEEVSKPGHGRGRRKE